MILEIGSVSVALSSHVCCIWILSYVIDVVALVFGSICKSVGRVAMSLVVHVFSIIHASIRPIEDTFAVLVTVWSILSLVK